MINGLLRHDHSVRNIASTIVIHRYQNNDKDAFYLFFDPLTASVMEPCINLARHPQRAARRGRRATEKKKNVWHHPHVPHHTLNYIPSLRSFILILPPRHLSRNIPHSSMKEKRKCQNSGWQPPRDRPKWKLACVSAARTLPLQRSIPGPFVHKRIHVQAVRRGCKGGLHIPKLGQRPLESTLPTLTGRNRYNDTRENIRSDAFPQLQRPLQPTSGREHRHCVPVWHLCFLTLKTAKIITVGCCGLKIKTAPCPRKILYVRNTWGWSRAAGVGCHWFLPKSMTDWLLRSDNVSGDINLLLSHLWSKISILVDEDLVKMTVKFCLKKWQNADFLGWFHFRRGNTRLHSKVPTCCDWLLCCEPQYSQ